MAKTAVLITGANGELGHSLIPILADKGSYDIYALDVASLDTSLKPYITKFIQADILNKDQIEKLINGINFTEIFHLAAILSTGAEADPERAHNINVNGTMLLLSRVKQKTLREDITIKFIFPSSIAAYGVSKDLKKANIPPVKENEYLQPITMYGINKLYCEHLGRYYSKSYRLTSTEEQKGNLDFRSVRFPGIISAVTLPTGGTSDYAPEMIHSAAKGDGYESFVRPDTKIPFMVMPDAIKAIISLSDADKQQLTTDVYNVSAFSATAEEIAKMVNSVFPDSAINYNPHEERQSIVDSWPSEIDDTKAKTDWGWTADYNIEKAFKEYLIPEISERYKTTELQVYK